MSNREELVRKSLEKQQYGLVGKHSACKICAWTKKSLKDEDVCYKQTFYGIRSHLCCQITPCFTCPNSCIFCWRDTSAHTAIKMDSEIDSPEEIIEGCIKAQRKLIGGFGGNKLANKKKLKDAMEPMHFAISLSGEPTLYPRLGELIKELHKRGKTTFLVTNGMFPEVLEKIELPTQLYVSVDAPNEELFKKIDRPLLKDGWERLNKTLDLLKKLKKKTRTTIRLTIIKGINDVEPENYAKLIEKAQPLFVEVKAYMHVGYSRHNLEISHMPLHKDILEFSRKICENCSYKLIDEKKESRVTLLMQRDFKGRVMKFD